MTELTDEAVKALLDGATPGPWRADGSPYNRIVWSSNENRVCFMAHTNGLDDARDNATSNLVAAAPALARALLDARAELAQARADAQAAVALAYETAADLHAKLWRETNGYKEAQIRALAPASGVAKLAELRAERDAMFRRAALAEEWRDHDKVRAEKAEAELADAKQRERALVGALETGRYYVHQLAKGGRPGSCEASEDLAGIDAALAEVQVRDDASTPPADTWHERRTMLPDGDARAVKARGE